eukprot:153422-Pyramimonas_sp.AAC.1
MAPARLGSSWICGPAASRASPRSDRECSGTLACNPRGCPQTLLEPLSPRRSSPAFPLAS